MRKLFWPVPMMGKPRMTRSDRWKKRKVTTRYWSLKDALNIFAKRDGYAPSIMVTTVYLMEMPQSWSQKKKKEKAGTFHDAKPDNDNMLKAFKDSLLNDDSKVAIDIAVKIWSYEPGIIVIERTDTDFLRYMGFDIGLWKNIQDRSGESTDALIAKAIFGAVKVSNGTNAGLFPNGEQGSTVHGKERDNTHADDRQNNI